MNLTKLFGMQQALDQHIEEKHQLQESDLFSRKVLALLVEVGELANETKCFKFWSVKPSSPKDVILEEFVDGVHFILSLGIECGFDRKNFEVNALASSKDVTEQFLYLYKTINDFQQSKSFEDYVTVMGTYLQLGTLLEISETEMEQAYFAKNEVNYQRQANNY
ncbi:dUTP diphosphatase [Neobacillus dielmonensis]|uniref:dUTP diphosphatase n=1 Tax=Neobacillus dielmonensis TaxID=1347369 RepID=UPI0005A761A6|nr:dUTP diphosphatase [Neobacillus dielmonensis]